MNAVNLINLTMFTKRTIALFLLTVNLILFMMPVYPYTSWLNEEFKKKHISYENSILIKKQKVYKSSEINLDEINRKIDLIINYYSNLIISNDNTSNEQAFLYYRRAEFYLRKNNITKALADINESLAQYSTKEAYAFRCNLYDISHEYKKALLDCNQAISLGTNDPLIYLLTGELSKKIGDYERSLKMFDQYLDSKPEDIDVLEYKGDILLEIADFKEAINLYNSIIQIYKKKQNDDSDYINAYLNLAYAYYYLGDYKNSLAQYNEIEKIDSKLINMIIGKASALYELSIIEDTGLDGSLDYALKAYSSGGASSDPYLLYLLTKIYTDKCSLHEAKQFFLEFRRKSNSEQDQKELKVYMEGGGYCKKPMGSNRIKGSVPFKKD